MNENKPKKISLSAENLKKISGGYDLGTKNSESIARSLSNVNPPKYPCPKCGSWNVANNDPGALFKMRVYCQNCGFYGCRDGEEDEYFTGHVVEELRKIGLL